ncbi:hypothetical protein VO63_10105 [Streptomyces showdoensis]|uniref:Uncharacterized protein n=1 Tax=Streptomyces showdoensis TaxID=68268 RepID=A0A2P2GR16_STREW|nr:hypothetical protein VO63_10105 [Streptomyces showdoensis]
MEVLGRVPGGEFGGAGRVAGEGRVGEFGDQAAQPGGLAREDEAVEAGGQAGGGRRRLLVRGVLGGQFGDPLQVLRAGGADAGRTGLLGGFGVHAVIMHGPAVPPARSHLRYGAAPRAASR